MRRLIVLLGSLAAIASVSLAAAAPSSAAAIGKTGLYKDSCGNTHIWVNGNDLGPQYLVCMPPAVD